MSIYKNIFHYYRGQTRKGSEETKQLQTENNVTKAFINVLQYSSPILIRNFIQWLGLKENSIDSFEYMYQVSYQLHRKTPQAVVIGIAETDKIINNIRNKKYYIPDGAILSNSVSILIETKIGLNSYLEINQLEEFCVINCIGGPKTNEYFFLQFEKVKTQELVRKIHDYIWYESGYKDTQDAETSDGIGYKKIKKPKFATLTTKRQRCLILHIGKKEKRIGLSVQEEIDSLLGRKFERKEYEFDKYPHEAYIRLEWVDDFEQIRPYIDLAYELR